MELFIDQVLNGIGRGAVYASVGLALVIIYRTTGLLNFAQGEMALFSTFVTWWLTDQGVGIVPAIIGSVVFSVIAGAAIERLLIRPVESAHSPLNVVIVTLGMFLAINALAQLIFIKPGQEALQMPSPFPEGELMGIRKETIGLALVLALECVLLWVLLQRTKLGLSLRAVASNPESARLVGINTGVMLMVGWGLAAGLGAIAGSLVASQSSGFDTSLMQQILVYSFAGAALGGFDSPIGAVVGGLIVGVAEALTYQYGPDIGLAGIELVVPLGLILVVLLVKPNGLFGRTIVERV
ncbi:MAG: branched-chain amino acid ABC transporter permease [Microthrixaceae bacterium]|jgi:branched-chain amino acid transport system permease protein|nr:branched-chain amino acid ABC transporter permease [Microthrixaceae bacterium]